MALGVYIAVPFCRSKCSYCNFSSGVFSRTVFANYIDKLCVEIARAPVTAAEFGGEFEGHVDSIYLGGGTPTVLEAAELERVFATLRQNFVVAKDAEITVECAPGSLKPEIVNALLRCGVNRVSLGVQSFVDAEAAVVGRLHTRAAILHDIQQLRRTGISNLNVDLIAGLPHQTDTSWRESLECVIELNVPHVSVYMLEVDEDSRLGRELIAGGMRYHAHFVPDEDATADFYLQACERLNAAGVPQYEISNFARAGFQSVHNVKYWTRQPYMGFGVDAHSMLKGAPPLPDFDGSAITGNGSYEAVRFSNPDSLDGYMAGAPPAGSTVSRDAAREEAFFLGLRLNRGVDLKQVSGEYGLSSQEQQAIAELRHLGLLECDHNMIRLTPRGRLLSNEVFQRFINESVQLGG